MPPKQEADMGLYAAIDLHSNNSVVVVTNASHQVVLAKRFRNDLESIVTALRSCAGEVRAVAVESTYNWYWLVDGLRSAGFDVRLVNTASVSGRATTLSQGRQAMSGAKNARIGNRRARSFARSGRGQAGCETSNVRPMTPVKAVPGVYSFNAMACDSRSGGQTHAASQRIGRLQLSDPGKVRQSGFGLVRVRCLKADRERGHDSAGSQH
jgi:hypothetical protein